MSKVVDRLAELTGFRDRDLLDITLAGALRDLLHPQRVSIHRAVGDDADRRWLTRASIGADDPTATADPLWVKFETLPRLEDFPERHKVLLQQERLLLAPAKPALPHHLAIYPLSSDREAVGVLEIETTKVMTTAEQRLVGSILRIYRNVQSLLDYSERDSLTGLLNRKTFDETFYKLAWPARPGARTWLRRWDCCSACC